MEGFLPVDCRRVRAQIPAVGAIARNNKSNAIRSDLRVEQPSKTTLKEAHQLHSVPEHEW